MLWVDTTVGDKVFADDFPFHHLFANLPWNVAVFNSLELYGEIITYAEEACCATFLCLNNAIVCSSQLLCRWGLGSKRGYWWMQRRSQQCLLENIDSFMHVVCDEPFVGVFGRKLVVQWEKKFKEDLFVTFFSYSNTHHFLPQSRAPQLHAHTLRVSTTEQTTNVMTTSYTERNNVSQPPRSKLC